MKSCLSAQNGLLKFKEPGTSKKYKKIREMIEDYKAYQLTPLKTLAIRQYL
jgi:hypothetical protein